jgi:ABC-type sugar transport system permease subunit
VLPDAANQGKFSNTGVIVASVLPVNSTVFVFSALSINSQFSVSLICFTIYFVHSLGVTFAVAVTLLFGIVNVNCFSFDSVVAASH